MDFKSNIYKVEFTEVCKEEMIEIYRYISENLVAENSAKKLMKKIKKAIMNLDTMPFLYAKIKKNYGVERDYRRIVVDNFVVLYTVDIDIKKIYIVHIYYGGKNYL